MIISTAPIVVIGMHRSGTTFLAQVLERSGVLMGRDMIAYAESRFFQRCNEDLLARKQAHWDKPATTDERPLLYNTREHFTRYGSLRKHPLGWPSMLTKKGWGWKDPRNTFTLGSWLKIFPSLHAIHICRNGLDVAQSLHERNAMLQPDSKWHSARLTDLHDCFTLWEAYVNQAQSWKGVLGKRYVQVRYEDLVATRADAIKTLEDFCGRRLHKAVSELVNKERRIKEPVTEMDTLRGKARNNQTLLRLGYAV